VKENQWYRKEWFFLKLSEAKQKALTLMREYSVDGVLIPSDENEDYTNSMNRFANDAQMEISEKLPIETSYTFDQTGTNEDGYNKYSFQNDCKQFLYINKDDERFNHYRVENRKILLKKQFDGTFEVFYEKYPTELDSTTEDDYEFEVDRHAHSLIPYYLGAMAIAVENISLSDKLLNMFYSKLAALSEPVNETPTHIISSYRI
jgi:hypothetical protein